MSQFFIQRPVFAWVIAIMVMLSGVIAIFSLPVAQYPDIAPPAVQISASYPGADAKTVEDTVTQIIEQKINGLDGVMYFSSTSDAMGNAVITVTFESGTDPDIAQVQVQNKLQLAIPLLPQAVQSIGINVQKASSAFLMVVGFTAAEGSSLTQSDISDYVSSSIMDTLSRVQGVGQVQLFGSQYAMRIWLDPHKLNSYSMTAEDVVLAIKSQNSQITGGQLGAQPAPESQLMNASIIAQTRLNTPEQFSNIILRVNPDGSHIRLRNVATVELGSESYSTSAQYNGRPAAGLGIKLAPGANALDTASALKNELSSLKPFFPAGIDIVYPYDTTPFVKISIHEVMKTLVEAIVLVFIVMFMFLQNLRATLIPTIAVPVVLLGTFGILAIFGFSVNTLTMFGMVLAIGLLVDDAIVVVENVERVMTEEGLSPKDATRKSMQQIQGALLGITVVLSAVFVPMAFFSGSSGAIYQQFSVTIVSAMVLSVLTAMILTPALCSTILKPSVHKNESAVFRNFNKIFDASTSHYQGALRRILKCTGRIMAIYFAILVGICCMFIVLPASFLPDEDQGVFMNLVQLPSGATQSRTQKTLDNVNDYYLHDEAKNVNSVFTVAGFGLNGNGQQNGIAFVSLKDWKLRDTAENRVDAIIERANKAFTRKVVDGIAFAFNLPAIPELGTATGFDFELIDKGNNGRIALINARNQMLFMAQKFPHLVTKVRPNGMEDSAQFKLEIDQQKAEALGVSVDAINRTISTALGGNYVNDFIDRGRVKKVYVQADQKFRMQPEDINNWYVKADNNQMVPFSAFSGSSWVSGPSRIEHYNGRPSIEILGEPTHGKSSGLSMKFMEKLAEKLPPGFDYQWTGLSYQQQLSGAQAPALYAISLVVVFLCLAALYESWAVPVAVMLVVPVGVSGALIAATIFSMKNDVYFQVGLLTTIGLSAKNAIMIVEFARQLIEKNNIPLLQATLEAARMRFRPILMTSLAFILGVFPLVINSGAGSGAQNAIGTGVMGGMIAATLLAIYFVPVFYVVVIKMTSKNSPS